jgi:Holliday junction resolvase RusA-like endonuclease
MRSEGVGVTRFTVGLPAIEFTVPGVPAPQGSKRAWVVAGKAVMTEANARTRDWRAAVSDAAAQAMQNAGRSVIDGPVLIDVSFFFARPKSHFGTRGLRGSAPMHKTTAPDVDKLARAVLDAITGIVIRDDAQVVSLSGHKLYADDCLVSAHICVMEMAT